MAEVLIWKNVLPVRPIIVEQFDLPEPPTQDPSLWPPPVSLPTPIDIKDPQYQLYPRYLFDNPEIPTLYNIIATLVSKRVDVTFYIRMDTDPTELLEHLDLIKAIHDTPDNKMTFVITDHSVTAPLEQVINKYKIKLRFTNFEKLHRDDY
jgi:hypothetical protein